MPGLDCEVRVDCRAGEAFCAKCCRNAVVPLLRGDYERLKARLGDVEGYVEWVEGVPVLKRVNGACVFLEEATGRCRVYEDRPLACRLYPLVYTPGKWVHADPRCPRAASVTMDVVARCGSLVEKFPLLLKESWGPEPGATRSQPAPLAASWASAGATQRGSRRGI
ncbi:YkgJ family cysteine cluster protein [Infirmifilum sp. SLHALR2]|nr:MAG: hypothetical protein B7L53_01360 [Thermofilum sp. NZ13]